MVVRAVTATVGIALAATDIGVMGPLDMVIAGMVMAAVTTALIPDTEGTILPLPTIRHRMLYTPATATDAATRPEQ